MIKCEITFKTAANSKKRVIYGLYESTIDATIAAYSYAGVGVCYTKVKRVNDNKLVKECTVNGCVNEARTRGWCSMHYARWKSHGDTSIVKKTANGGYVADGYAGHQIDGVKKFDHVRIAESVLGRELPSGSVVHHANRDRSDNRNENLVICPDRSYHNLLHARLNAADATGNPDSRKCRYCSSYDDISRLHKYKKGKTTAYWHRDCANKYNRDYRSKRSVDI